ncbi:MAG TPA: lysylphosphatidylglycerol synthase domain-containing protein [Vicinamibacterales bacterium]
MRRWSATGVIIAAAGALLFAWYVRQAGPSEIWGGLRAIGWGFLPIIAIAGLRFALRAWALSLCVEPPARLAFRGAFAAVLAGDAIGNLTPLGLIASEPMKAALIRGDGPLRPAIGAVAIETLIYTLSVAAMIAATTIALLISFNLSEDMQHAAWIAIAAIAAGFVATAILVWRQPAIVGGLVSRILPAGSRLQSIPQKLHDLEQQILTFATRRRDVIVPIAAAEIAFHALGVAEIALTVWLIVGAAPPLLTAFILEGANRLVQVVFKPVPLRAGVDEVTTGMFTRMLGYGVALGATMGIVRKVRTIFWMSIGMALLVRRGVGRTTTTARN